MADTIYSVIGSLDNIPTDYQAAVVCVCLILIALLLIVAVDSVGRFFSWLFARLG